MVRQPFKRSGSGRTSEKSNASSGENLGLLQRFQRWNQQRSAIPQSINIELEHDAVRDERREGAPVATSEVISDDQPVRQPIPPSSPSPSQPGRSWRWTILCLAVLGMVSGMGAAALLWLVSLPPPPECKNPTSLTLDIERLYCAQQAVQSGGLPELIAGLELLQRWDSNDSLYAETQKLAEDWSKQVLTIAREKVLQSDLNGALDAIRYIPKSTSVYQEAQEFATYWQEQWKEGQAIDAKAQEALKQQNWTLASEQVAALADFANPYWNTQRANALAQQIGAEKQARQVLVRARNAAQAGQPEQFAQAITIAQEIPQNTHTWQDARQDLRKWSQTLVAIGIKRWQAGDRKNAVMALQTVPRSTTIPELEDWVWFGSAYKLLNDSLPSSQPSHNWSPASKQVWNLMEASAAIGKVKPNSPFYQQAQAMRQDLQAQLDDLTQLYYATLVANLGQHSTLNLAIDQARQITPARPRRVQAQTLIAAWYDQIERLEDQPYLDRATALAKSGEIPDLQAAIAEASLIRQGRALRKEAQGWIATWRDQIETIEDQPYLDRAWAFANAGNLSEAIAAAEMIRPGRALYGDAQSVIYTWQARLIRERQLAEDRPILDRAKAIANSGDLYTAIQVASQIAAGRALYAEAQGLISTWNDQLNPPQPQPNPLDLDKADKEEKLPGILDEESGRSPEIFVWPDGSLSPYSPSDALPNSSPNPLPNPSLAPSNPPTSGPGAPSSDRGQSPQPVAPPNGSATVGPETARPQTTVPGRFSPEPSPSAIELPQSAPPPPISENRSLSESESPNNFPSPAP